MPKKEKRMKKIIVVVGMPTRSLSRDLEAVLELKLNELYKDCSICKNREAIRKWRGKDVCTICKPLHIRR